MFSSTLNGALSRMMCTKRLRGFSGQSLYCVGRGRRSNEEEMGFNEKAHPLWERSAMGHKGYTESFTMKVCGKHACVFCACGTSWQPSVEKSMPSPSPWWPATDDTSADCNNKDLHSKIFNSSLFNSSHMPRVVRLFGGSHGLWSICTALWHKEPWNPGTPAELITHQRVIFRFICLKHSSNRDIKQNLC